MLCTLLVEIALPPSIHSLASEWLAQCPHAQKIQETPAMEHSFVAEPTRQGQEVSGRKVSRVRLPDHTRLGLDETYLFAVAARA